MYRRIDDFLKSYETQTGCTSKIFAVLSDKNLGQTVADGHRSLGWIAWHIVTTIAEMMSRTGLTISSIDHDSAPPDSADKIQAAYRAASAELVESLKTGWNDDSLLETDDMYGQEWPRGITLTALMNHEIHHRGQMTVLLRQAGEKVPGTFGPAKEEWTQYGMTAPPH